MGFLIMHLERVLFSFQRKKLQAISNNSICMFSHVSKNHHDFLLSFFP